MAQAIQIDLHLAGRGFESHVWYFFEIENSQTVNWLRLVRGRYLMQELANVDIIRFGTSITVAA